MELKRHILLDTENNLLDFIKTHYEVYNGDEVVDIENKIKELGQLDESTIRFGIARMKKAEVINDYSPTISFMVTFSIAIIFAYSSLWNDYSEAADILNLSMLMLFFSVFVVILTKAKFKKAKIIFFKSLLEDALSKKKK